MIRLGNTVLGGTPRVAVGFKDGVSFKTLRDMEKSGLDVFELRIDLYASFDPARILREADKFKKYSTIATIRSKKEGGAWKGSEKARMELFKAVLPSVSAVDIELSSREIAREVVLRTRALKKQTIVSYHNFERTPKNRELTRVLKDAKSLGADIVKIAAFAHSPEEVRVLAGFTLANAAQNIIVIAMGPEGAVSRLLFPALGSLLTYASLQMPLAPGQLDYGRTSEMLRELYPRYHQEKGGFLKTRRHR